MNKAKGWGFIPRLVGKANQDSVENPRNAEDVVGETLTPELFRSELSDLGYDFEVFVRQDGKIWRFRRIPAETADTNGDVW